MNFIKFVFGTTDVSWNYTLGRNERELFLLLLATIYLNLPISYINTRTLILL